MNKFGYIISAFNKDNPDSIKYLAVPEETHNNTPFWVWTDNKCNCKFFNKRERCKGIIKNLDKNNLNGLFIKGSVNKICFKILFVEISGKIDKKTITFGE